MSAPLHPGFEENLTHLPLSGGGPAHVAIREIEDTQSAVTWSAVLAGAVAAAALSLILLILGAGLGMAVVSPWVNEPSPSGAALGAGTIAWLALTQIFASGLGGYIAGRMRQVWVRVHTSEAWFRDTVHGMLSWAVASLLMAALLGTVAASLASGVLRAGGAAAATAAAATTVTAGATATRNAPADSAAARTDGQRYLMDSMYRRELTASPIGTGVASAATATIAAAPSTSAAGDNPANPNPEPVAAGGEAPADTAQPAGMQAEGERIMSNALRAGSLPAEDANYLARGVALRAGLDLAQAQVRVADTFTRLQAQRTALEQMAREQADAARKASSHAALWMFVSLLMGAFVASLLATVGSRQRFAA